MAKLVSKTMIVMCLLYTIITGFSINSIIDKVTGQLLDQVKLGTIDTGCADLTSTAQLCWSIDRGIGGKILKEGPKVKYECRCWVKGSASFAFANAKTKSRTGALENCIKKLEPKIKLN